MEHSLSQSFNEHSRMRIFKYKFITKLDDALKCKICSAAATDPWQHGRCGSLFCEECLKDFGREKTCPHCNGKKPQYFEDTKSKKKIKNLCVRCENVSKGCKWEGIIGTLHDHVTEECQFTEVPCPNDCKKGRWIVTLIMRKDLEEHLKKCPNREHQCEYCGKKDTYVSITDEHDKICGKEIVLCTNTECTMTMEREKIKAHVANDCEYTEISCKYESIGCDVKIKRSDLRSHEEEDSIHLCKALDTILELKKTTEQLVAWCKERGFMTN